MRADVRWWQTLGEAQRRAERRADDLENFFGPGPFSEAARRGAPGEPAAQDGREHPDPDEEGW
jgi:hypothetical protein